MGAYSGLLTSNTGKTHHALDDIGLMTMLPNTVVIAPADANETRQAMKAMLGHHGPVYLRLTRADDIPNSTSEISPFVIGKGAVLREGRDVAIISTGSMTSKALEAVSLLEENGLSAHLLHLPTLKPIDEASILDAARRTRMIFTVEEHYIRGGLGSMVSEFLSEASPARITRIGVNNEYSECGKNQDLLDKHGLTPEKIAKRILDTWEA